MRIDSCRRCGFDMRVRGKCPACREAIKFVCKNCHVETEEQIHFHCRLINTDYHLSTAEVI